MPLCGNLSAVLVNVTVLVMMSISIELLVREDKKRGVILAPTDALKCALLPLIFKVFFDMHQLYSYMTVTTASVRFSLLPNVVDISTGL